VGLERVIEGEPAVAPRGVGRARLPERPASRLLLVRDAKGQASVRHVELDLVSIDPCRDRLTVEPLKRAGAIIGVPERPGPGPEVDRAVLERYAVTTGERKR